METSAVCRPTNGSTEASSIRAFASGCKFCAIFQKAHPARKLIRRLPSQFAKNSRGDEPAKDAGPGWRQALDVDPADRAFLERKRPARADEAGCQLADARFVAHERNARPAPVLFEITQDPLRAAVRGQRLDDDNRRAGAEPAGHDIRGLPRAN